MSDHQMNILLVLSSETLNWIELLWR